MTTGKFKYNSHYISSDSAALYFKSILEASLKSLQQIQKVGFTFEMDVWTNYSESLNLTQGVCSAVYYYGTFFEVRIS